MIKLYHEISDRLNQIDFEAIWHGFHLYPFALYTQHEAIMNGAKFLTPDSFYGNTTIQFEGQQIAIWNIELDLPESLDLLAASLVHEMFHAFQMEHGEQRFPNDLALFASALTPESLAWRIWERQLLADEYSLPKFCSARLAHRNDCITHEEELVETAEGMAQFVEFRVLGQLSDLSLVDSLEKCRMHLRNADLAVDIRRCGYDSGAYMLWEAVESKENIFHVIGQEKKTAFEIILQQISTLPPINRPPEAILKKAVKLLNAQKQRRQAEIDEFYKTTLHRVKGPYQICGYDPMNMWRQENIFFSSSFIALKNKNGEIFHIQGNALLHMESNSVDTVTDYLIPETNFMARSCC